MSSAKTVNQNEKDLKFREMSLSGNMWKVVIAVGGPLALYRCLQQVFSILDTMMASHISSQSVSAVAYLSQIITIIRSIGTGLSIGGSIQIARAFGQGDYDLVRKRVSTLYCITGVLVVLVLGLILPFLHPIMVMSGLPENLIGISAPYFRVQIITTAITFFNNVYISVERSRGNSKRILWLNLMVILAKLTLTAWFVYGLNGSLVTIAYATMISEGLLFVFSMKSVFARDSMFSFSPKQISMKPEVVSPMVSKSVPVIVEKALFAFGKTVVNSMSTVFGDTMVGAIGVSNNLGGITTMPQNGFQDGTSSVISQNFGAGKYERVIEAFKVTALICMGLGLSISTLELLNLEALASLFSGSDLEFRQMIKMVYTYEALGAVPLGLNSAIMGMLFGLGEVRMASLINICRVFVFRIPVFWMLIHWTDLGIKSCGCIMMISNTLTAMFASVIAVIVLRRFCRKYLPDRKGILFARKRSAAV